MDHQAHGPLGEGPPARLVWDVEAEGAAKKGSAASRGEEEDEAILRSYHDTLPEAKAGRLLVNQQEGGMVSPPGQKMHKNQATGCRDPPVEAPGHASPPHGKYHVRSLRRVREGAQNGTPQLHRG